MRQRYNEIESTYGTKADYPDSLFNRGPAHQTQQIAGKILGTDARMKRWEGLLADAVRLAQTDTEKQRVDLWKRAVWALLIAGKAAVN